MNNNYYEIPTDWYSEFNNTFMNNNPSIMNNNTYNMNNDLTDPKTALDRGNLFNNLYDSYRNYKYRQLKPTNRKEELLYNILMHNFALTELDLYLDLNPNNQNMLNLYNRYLNNKKQLVSEYETNFGPLTLDGNNLATNDWNWRESPWPWEGTK